MSELTSNYVYIGAMKISYGPVYNSVSQKFDEVHTNLMKKFSAMLAE